MVFVKIICKNSESFQPRGTSNFDVSELVRLFNIPESGLHMKYNDCGSWEVLWPSDGQFTLPSLLISEVYLIGVEKGSVTQTTFINSNMTMSSQIGDYSYLERRGNIASSFKGPRAIPSFKKKLKTVPGPLKKRNKEACIKHFQVSKINENGGLVTLYYVPIDLEKLKDEFGEFTIENI